MTDGMSDDDVLAQLAESMPALVVFRQEPDELMPSYHVSEDIPLDDAVSIAVKGLFVLVLDAMGFWDDEEDSDTGDDSPG